MTERRIILFRGMNTGGVRAPVGDQRAMAEDLGFKNPRTLLASGNLVVESDRVPSEIERLVEAETERRFGRRIGAVVKTAEDWAGLIAANPFRREGEAEPSKLLVLVFRDPPPARVVDDAAALAVGEEKAAVAADALWLWLPDGIGRSKMAEKSPSGKVGLVTGRNWATVLKLGAMVGL